SLARPGGNLTAISEVAVQLHAKRLELLKYTIPTLTRVVTIMDPTTGERVELDLRENEDAAQALGIDLQALAIRGPDALPAGVEAATRQHADGLITLIGPAVAQHTVRIAELAVEHRLPMMADRRGSVVAGALMGYGPSEFQTWRRVATYVDKILQGAKPGDLP